MTKLFLIIILNIFFLNCPYAAETPSSEQAKEFVSQLTSDVLKVIEDTHNTDTEKFSRLSNMFIDNVDTLWISKFVLGASYRSMTQDQKDEFANLYKSFLVSVYVPKFREYHKEKINIQNVERTGESFFKVYTLIDRGEKQNVKVDYLIGYNFTIKKLMVYDIVAEDISMITTHRSEFTSLYTDKGYDGMKSYILEKVKSADQDKADQANKPK